MNAIRPPLWSELTSSELLNALTHPPDRYRPVPWLAWTGDLEWPVLQQQLGTMVDQGITEFFLFPIYGMELPYMSVAYWERVEQTLAFCRENGMKCWIYDEYNWPSGVCAGRVLRDHPEHREQHLWLRPAEGEPATPPSDATDVNESGGAIWTVAPRSGVAINVRGCDWVSPVPGYLDVLSLQANRCFIESTHERYHGRFSDMFPETLPGFFTDEPGLHATPAEGWSQMPYTDDLFDAFLDRYGYDLRDHLGDLILETPTARRTRCHYWCWVAERFGRAYGEQQRNWCDEHGVLLTGHALGEENLSGHVRYSGDLWEILRHFTIPGIDLLANADGFTFPYRVGFYSGKERRGFHLTCKFVHGIVRHSGGREMMSEAYGVCDWGMNLFRQKCGFHYQVALGVTLFNDNSLITSIADFRKWAIAGKHFTQPWWPYYRQYADYNARLAALHAEGDPVAEIAVLYPRSTIWARCGATAEESLRPLETFIYDLLDELIREQWPFDFVFEPILADARIEDDELVTSHARYRVLIVPSATDLPKACVNILREFAEAGGILLFCGAAPEREVDAQSDLSEAVRAMLAGDRTSHLDASGAEVCHALEGYLTRPLTLSGESAREFVSSRRRLAESEVLFVANMAESPGDVEMTLNLDGPLVVCDPDTLACYRPQLGDGRRFAWHFEPWQAYLIIVGDAAIQDADLSAEPSWWSPKDSQVLDGEWAFSVEPGNMLRLTMQVRPDPDNQGVAQGWHREAGNAGWIEDEDDRQLPDPILTSDGPRILVCDNDAGWIEAEDGRQLPDPILPGDAPWYWMRTVVSCDAPDGPRFIVCDNPDVLEVYVNGRAAEQIQHEPLWTEENVWFDVHGLFVEGPNAIHIRARTSKYNDPRIGPFPASAKLLQPVVLVGDFLVGDDVHLLPWAGALHVDRPWEEQGLPHLAGEGTYRRRLFWSGGGRRALHLPKCTDAVEVHLNGEPCGVRAWTPYVFDLTPHLRKGENEVEIRVHNTLGNIITETYGGARPAEFPVSGMLSPPRLLTV